MLKKPGLLFLLGFFAIIMVACDEDDDNDIVPDPNAWYTIQAASSRKCLDVADKSSENGGNIQQWTCEGQLNQWFKFVEQSGYYNIEAYGNGKCLNVTDWSWDNSANIQQWDCENRPDDNKLFLLHLNNNDYYTIQSKHSGKCLDVADRSEDNGANIQQWDCHGDSNQVFRLIEIDF